MFISLNFFYQSKQRLIKCNYWPLSRIQRYYSFGNNIKGVFDQYWWLWIIVPQSKHIGEGWILSLTYTLMLPMIHYLVQLLQPFLHVQAILILSHLLQILSFQKTLLTLVISGMYWCLLHHCHFRWQICWFDIGISVRKIFKYYFIRESVWNITSIVSCFMYVVVNQCCSTAKMVT